MCKITVLFARKNSIYHQLNCDVWDKDRDARLWLGQGPIIAHPPCRAWGRMAHQSVAPPWEKDLAIWALQQVRAFGGVLEHPETSRLWEHIYPNERLITVDQYWWGHRAIKRTKLLLVGCREAPMPFRMFGDVTPVTHMCRAERERTPPDFARWLIETVKTKPPA